MVDDGHHLVGQSLQGVSRVAGIIREVRGFAHTGSGERQWCDINELLESAVRIAMPQLRRSAKLIRSYGPVPRCECAGQDLKLVFLDLLLAAVAAMEGSGTIRLVTERVGDEILVELEDDGRGYSPEEIEQAFDPAVGCERRGGPDLCISHQIIRQHGGDIKLRSELGSGSSVQIRLPIGEPELAH
jgi:signal transduction histidine kinase